MQRRDKSHSGAGRGTGRPPGLSGREIGMYYRNLARQRKKDDNEEKKIRLGCDVSVPPTILKRVNECMEQFEAGDINVENLDANFKQQFRQLLSVNFDEFVHETKKQHEGVEYRNCDLDQRLRKEHKENLQSPEFSSRYKERLKLPTMAQAGEIIKAVEQNQVILIVGSTGCGKTTQVPQLLLDDCIAKGIGTSCHIVCTQPRRISAITVAERVSYERNESLGQSVGYQIRLEGCKPRERASIKYCTTGILLQQMQSDPLLHNVSVLILDEIHERSVETDLVMALLKYILPQRPSLKVILMSATVREQDFCDYFNQCPMLRIEGTMFPVEVLYLEDVLTLTGYRFGNRQSDGRNKKHKRDQPEHRAMIEPYIRRMRGKYADRVLDQLRLTESEGCEEIDFIADLVFYICETQPDGAILIFMPGFDKISQLHRALESPRSAKGQRWRDYLQLFPLHSKMPSVEQQAVFRRPPKGKRKVIISTIISETSVTIDDVVYVINTGRTKMSNYDIDSNIQTLEECWVTQANTQQRKGRAGRVQPGICYNLFSRARENLMSEVPTPEILRCKLESIILSLKLLHIDDPYVFLKTLINAPVEEAIGKGIALLKR